MRRRTREYSKWNRGRGKSSGRQYGELVETAAEAEWRARYGVHLSGTPFNFTDFKLFAVGLREELFAPLH